MAHGGRRLTYRLAAAQGRCAPPGHHPVACQSYICLRSYPVGPLGRSCHQYHGEPLHDRALVTEGPQFGVSVNLLYGFERFTAVFTCIAQRRGVGVQVKAIEELTM